MNEIEVSAEHMKALQVLAGVNLTISEAKNSLTRLQEQETEYLVSREKKAVDIIKNALEISHNLVEETNKNYDVLNDFARNVATGASFLEEAYQKFQGLVESKDTFYEAWERDIKNQEETVTALRNNLKVDAVTIDAQRKALNALHVGLDARKRKIDDERGEIDRKIMRFKQGKI